MATRRRVPALLLGLLLSACAPAVAPVPPASPVPTTPDAQVTQATPTAQATQTLSLDGRNFQLLVPPGYDPARPTGLVIGLHGYSSTAEELDSYFGLSTEAAERGLLVALPEGTQDSSGNRFWNATESCCDFNDSGVDDSDYLSRLIEQVLRSYAVDPGRVYVVGHSNGGFMAHRLACEHADQVAGIMSLAGAQNSDRSACRPSRPVSVLQVHGTKDETVDFSGSTGYPSARNTVKQWADLNDCSGKATTGPKRDLDTTLSGKETTTTAWTSCKAGSAVALWAIKAGPHIPELAPSFAAQVLTWLEAHAR